MYEANLPAALSLVTSTGGITLIPLHAQNMLAPNVIARALDGEPPTIDLVLGYDEANASHLLHRFPARADELVAHVQDQSIIRYPVWDVPRARDVRFGRTTDPSRAVAVWSATADPTVTSRVDPYVPDPGSLAESSPASYSRSSASSPVHEPQCGTMTRLVSPMDET